MCIHANVNTVTHGLLPLRETFMRARTRAESTFIMYDRVCGTNRNFADDRAWLKETYGIGSRTPSPILELFSLFHCNRIRSVHSIGIIIIIISSAREMPRITFVFARSSFSAEKAKKDDVS